MDDKQTRPVIALVADGSSDAEGQKALEELDSLVREHFPEHEVVWAVQAVYMIEALKRRGQTSYFQRNIPLMVASDLLIKLATEGHKKVAMQMLMTAESNFSRQAIEADTRGMTVKYGFPFLGASTPENQVKLAKSLELKYGDGKETATVLVGHGSDKNFEYNEWFINIDKYLRDNYENVCLATLHGPPGTENMVAGVKSSGCKKVRFISLMLSRGGHIPLDIMNDERPESWKNQIGLPAEVVDNFSENQALREHFIRSIESLINQL